MVMVMVLGLPVDCDGISNSWQQDKSIQVSPVYQAEIYKIIF